MNNIIKLSKYIESRSTKYDKAISDQDQLKIIFHQALTIKIVFCGYYCMYVNDIFYYDIDEQDIYDILNDIFDGNYVFCKVKTSSGYKIELVSNIKLCSNDNIINAWTIKETIK